MNELFGGCNRLPHVTRLNELIHSLSIIGFHSTENFVVRVRCDPEEKIILGRFDLV